VSAADRSAGRSVALVTAAGAWATDDDAEPLVAALAAVDLVARPARWDDPTVDWAGFDLVVLRSPWDYTERATEFLAWADAVAAVSDLRNPAEVLRWNTDKRYLGELAAAGLAVVPTTYLLAQEHGGTDASAAIRELLHDDGDTVVKPTVSAGSRDTARYTPSDHRPAIAHAQRLLDEGRDVMVQPYLASVDRLGETGMLFFGGEFSHGFRKGALLTDGAAQVDGLFAVEQIEPRQPSGAELTLARAVLDLVHARFGSGPLLYARVDVLADGGGAPQLLELELTEPSYFLATDPLSATRAAAAYAACLTGAAG